MPSDLAISLSGPHPIVNLLRTASLMHLLSPKMLSARARPLGKTENRVGRLVLFTAIGGIFWLMVFGLLYRLLRYFRGIPEIGALLAGKLLALTLLSLLGILILSNIVTALSSFFLAKDLDLLDRKSTRLNSSHSQISYAVFC